MPAAKGSRGRACLTWRVGSRAIARACKQAAAAHPLLALRRPCACLAASLGPLPCSAVRGLSNYMFHEAQRLAKEEVQKGHDKFDG